jgi:hypothetical protein
MGMSAASIMSALALWLMASPAAPNSSKTLDACDKIERKESLYSQAASVPAHFTCSWTANRGYMACEYNDTSKAYEHLGIRKDSKTLQEPSVIIEGNSWQYNYRKN